MKKYLFFFLLSSILFACTKPKQKVDLLILGPTIYTIDKDSSTYTAMAIDSGKIIALGNEANIIKKYTSDSIVKLPGKFIYPGLIDAHSHFYGLSRSMVTADLRGAKSEEEMIQKVVEFNSPENQVNSELKPLCIYGRGWDQNLWESKEFPTNEKLNELFPDILVCLTRIDGHAALVNQKVLDVAGIDENTKISGGEFVKKNGKLTGVLIDNAVDLVTSKLPTPDDFEMKLALQKAEEKCLSYGLTTVCDAGLDKEIIDIYDEMHKNDQLKIRIYAMANPTQPTLGWLLKNGPYKTARLHVHSVKYYMDGAMGSRGACLLGDYADQPGHKGFLLNPIDSLRALAIRLHDAKLQLNVHCIGDSANRVTLQTMAEVLGMDTNARWRIEHMQLISEEDLGYLKRYNIIPSMQPTHALSDGSWVIGRLGLWRLGLAYAIRTAMIQSGLVAFGTDFPVEEVNPFRTLYAAVAKEKASEFSWLFFEKVDRYQALQAMTIWAAYAQFEENEKGSLEPGKLADFIVLDQDLLSVHQDSLVGLLPSRVYINGKLVAGKEK